MNDCAGAWYTVVLTVEEKRKYRIWATDAEEAQALAATHWTAQASAKKAQARSSTMMGRITRQPDDELVVINCVYVASRGFPIVESVTELTPKETT